MAFAEPTAVGVRPVDRRGSIVARPRLRTRTLDEVEAKPCSGLCKHGSTCSLATPSGARQCCHHQPSVAPVARAPGALVPPYSGLERPWGACNAAAPLPARSDASGAQV